MSDVYVYVTDEDEPQPLSTWQIGDQVNVDLSAGQMIGVEILGALRVTIDGVDVGKIVATAKALVKHRDAFPADREYDDAELAQAMYDAVKGAS